MQRLELRRAGRGNSSRRLPIAHRDVESDGELSADFLARVAPASPFPPTPALRITLALACEVAMNHSLAMAALSEKSLRSAFLSPRQALARHAKGQGGVPLAHQLLRAVPAMRHWHRACSAGEARAAFRLLRDGPSIVGDD